MYVGYAEEVKISILDFTSTPFLLLCNKNRKTKLPSSDIYLKIKAKHININV